MSDANQTMGEIRSASARGDLAEALRLVKWLPGHMRVGVRAGLKREHQLDICTVCDGDGGWEASFGWGAGEGCDRYIACPVCEEYGTTTPEARVEWARELAMGEEACDHLTEEAASAEDFWEPPDGYW